MRTMLPLKPLGLVLLLNVVSISLATSQAHQPWFIHIHEPLNNSFVLANATRISLSVRGINTHTPQLPLQICLRLLSSYFNPIDMGCFNPTEIVDLRLGKIPYGQHQMRIELRGDNTVYDRARLNIHATPILPDSLVPMNQPFCTRKRAKRDIFHAEKSQFSMLVLVNRGGRAFRQAVRSWMDSGLLDLAHECIIFLQESPMDPTTDARLSFLTELPHTFRFVGASSQLGIGPAIMALLRAASSELVMFVEEDFQVNRQYVERNDMSLQREIQDAVGLVTAGVVDFVKLRHRGSPGLPFYPHVWKGRENTMLRTVTPYLSNHSVLESTHWLLDPLQHFPQSVLWVCDPRLRSFYCSFSTHAGWSNNPFIGKTSETSDLLEPVVQADWTKTIEGGINLSPHLWDHKCFVIAQGNGIFTHVDTDGRALQQQSPYEDPFGSIVQERLGALVYS